MSYQDDPDRQLGRLAMISKADVEGLKNAQKTYGNSWKKRGGVGAFMMLARKWDRIENTLKHAEGMDQWDIFQAGVNDQNPEGIVDDIRDLRRYLMLVESEIEILR